MPSRRRLFVASTAAVSLLAVLPAAAAIRSEQTFKLTLTSERPRTSTGVVFSTDRAAYMPPATGKPLTVSRVVFSLPPGTRINTAAARRCSVAVLERQGAAGCRAGSQIGSGTAVAITGTPLDPVNETVQLFATRAGMAAFLSGLQTAVIPMTVRANRITAQLPRFCLPPGTPADDCSAGEAVLKSLSVTIRARTRGTGRRARRLVTTPRTCPASRTWTSRATYTYANGDTERETSTTPCRRR